MSGKSPHHRKGKAYRVTLEPSMLRKPPGTRWLLFTDLALGKRTVASENLSVAFGSEAAILPQTKRQASSGQMQSFMITLMEVRDVPCRS